MDSLQTMGKVGSLPRNSRPLYLCIYSDIFLCMCGSCVNLCKDVSIYR